MKQHAMWIGHVSYASCGVFHVRNMPYRVAKMHTMPATSCRSLSAKEPLITGLFCET